MPPKKRIINFYTLQQKEWTTNNTIPAQRARYVINFISELDSKKKKVLDISKQKFCFLQGCSYNESTRIHSLIFKSARTAYRPDLLDRATIKERKNPKRATEGDGEMTHVIIKYTDDDVFVILEKNGKGINIGAIEKYFQKFAKKYMTSQNERINFSFQAIPMAKENFMDEIRRLSRVVLGEVFVEKSILGSPALNFSNRIQGVKRNIVMNIKAERQNTISSTIEDLYYKFTAPDSQISKLRVTGRNNNNGKVIIDTSFIEKVEHVKAEINDLTGVIISSSILEQLKEIAEGL